MTGGFSFREGTRLWTGRSRHALRSCGLAVLSIVFVYLAIFWCRHSKLPARLAHWRRPGKPAATGYVAAFDRCFLALRADARVRLIRYDFPLAALGYQQAGAGGWRLGSHRALLAGIAVPRAFRGALDDHGIVFIDPRTAPESALANPATPLPLAVLQRDFLLVPDLTGERRHAYQITAYRQLSMKR